TEKDHIRARGYFEESLKRFRQIGDRWESASVLRDLGHLAIREEDYARASQAYHEALAIFGDLGHQRGVARVLEHLASCALAQQQNERALKLLSAAAALREKLGTPFSDTERDELDRILKKASTGISAVDRVNSWSEGQTMSLQAVLEYAQAAEQAR